MTCKKRTQNQYENHPRVMKYRTFGITVTPHGTGKLLVHSQRSGTTRLLSRPQAHLLLACDAFWTLSDHAARNWLIGKALDHASEADIEISVHTGPITPLESHLHAFVDDGFLVSEADLREEIRELGTPPADGEDAANTITSLGIPTCDRPETLGRALASYVENATRCERALDVTVMDDSREADTQVLNQRAAQAVQRRYGVRIRYATREQRARFADELARYTGLSEDLLCFALLGDDRYGKMYGGNRNALLLDAAGERMVQVDDDTVCRITPAPDIEAGLALTSTTDANELWFFENVEDALDAVAPVDVDFLGIHEQLLGKKLAACIAAVEAAGEDLDFTAMESRFFDHMHASDAKVAVSFAGIVGDAGAQYRFRFLHGGDTFDRLVETEHAYRLGMTTRQMIKAARRPSISDGTFCMTTNIGVDHRTLLPPFVPVLRNEDGVFGCVLSTCFPGSFTGYVPYTVLHSPPEVRSLASEVHRQRYKTYLVNGLLMWIIMAFRDHPYCPDGARNLRSLGRYLQDLGALPQKGFAAFLRTVAWRAMHANVAYAERQLEERRGAPAYWVDDVEAYLEAALEAVVQPEFAIPSDLEGSATERLALFQELVAQFGTLLVHWPDIVEAAREMRGQGRRLAVAL